MKTRLEQRGATLILVIYYGLRYPEALWAPSVCTSMHELKHLGPQGVPQPRTSAKKDHQCRKHIVQTHFVFIKCVSSTVCQRKTSVPKMWPSLKQNATLTQWSPSPLVTALKPHHSLCPACSTPGGKYRKSLRSLSLDAGGKFRPHKPLATRRILQPHLLTTINTNADRSPLLALWRHIWTYWNPPSWPRKPHYVSDKPFPILSVHACCYESALQQTLSGWGGHSVSAEWL